MTVLILFLLYYIFFCLCILSKNSAAVAALPARAPLSWLPDGRRSSFAGAKVRQLSEPAKCFRNFFRIIFLRTRLARTFYFIIRGKIDKFVLLSLFHIMSFFNTRRCRAEAAKPSAEANEVTR